MIPSRSQFGEVGLPVQDLMGSQAELQEEMEETFVKLCDLLEQYAPAWYSDRLRERTESVRRQIGK